MSDSTIEVIAGLVGIVVMAGALIYVLWKELR
jgi:hypothetical protein